MFGRSWASSGETSETRKNIVNKDRMAMVVLWSWGSNVRRGMQSGKFQNLPLDGIAGRNRGTRKLYQGAIRSKVSVCVTGRREFRTASARGLRSASVFWMTALKSSRASRL